MVIVSPFRARDKNGIGRRNLLTKRHWLYHHEITEFMRITIKIAFRI